MIRFNGYTLMSGIFLTDVIPVELFEKADVTGSFDEIDEFINDHVIDSLADLDTGEVWEFIEEATNMARKFGAHL